MLRLRHRLGKFLFPFAGYGHQAPSTLSGRMYCILYALFGVPLNAILVGSLASLFTEQMTRFKNKMWQNVDGNNNDTTTARKHTLKRVFFEAVGFFLIFFVIFMPITAIIFSVLEGDDLGLTLAEGDWSFLNSLYFTFITFSTIGFGDMVPGDINIPPKNSAILK